MSSGEAQQPVFGKTPLPHAWSHILIGLGIVLFGGAVCGGLIARFLMERPVDLVPFTAAMADRVEEVLLTTRVPEQDIRRGAAEIREEPGARWRFSEFEVDVPAAIDPDGLEAVVRRGMALQHVSVSGESSELGAGRVLHLEIDGREFAVVRLSAASRLGDLSAACERIAGDIIVALEHGIPRPRRVVRGRSEPCQGPHSRGVHTRIEAAFPVGFDPEAVRLSLAEVLAGRDAQVAAVSTDDGDDAVLTVSYGGLECAEVRMSSGLPTASAVPRVQLPKLPGAAVRAADAPAAPGASEETPAAVNDTIEPEPVPELEALPLDSHELEEAALTVPREIPVGAGSRAPRANGPRVAIIVDDGGYGGETTEQILALEPVLTLAILPRCPYSVDTAQRGGDLGFEIMLHMPMESHSRTAKFPGALTVAMSKREIRKTTEEALADVPGATGVNTHTGSKFTSDEKHMRMFLKLCEDRSLYFVDSRTTADTVGYILAQDMGIPSAERDVFLDNEADAAYIQRQFEHLRQVAEKEGSAIGICHFRARTAEVLAQVLPEFKKQGIQVVHASELVH